MTRVARWATRVSKNTQFAFTDNCYVPFILRKFNLIYARERGSLPGRGRSRNDALFAVAPFGTCTRTIDVRGDYPTGEVRLTAVLRWRFLAAVNPFRVAAKPVERSGVTCLSRKYICHGCPAFLDETDK